MGTSNPLSKILQDAVLKLCTQTLPFSKCLEVDGIICVSQGREEQDIVVKIHQTVMKPRCLDPHPCSCCTCVHEPCIQPEQKDSDIDKIGENQTLTLEPSSSKNQSHVGVKMTDVSHAITSSTRLSHIDPLQTNSNDDFEQLEQSHHDTPHVDLPVQHPLHVDKPNEERLAVETTEHYNTGDEIRGPKRKGTDSIDEPPVKLLRNIDIKQEPVMLDQDEDEEDIGDEDAAGTSWMQEDVFDSTDNTMDESGLVDKKTDIISWKPRYALDINPDDYIQQQENASTQKKTKLDMRILQEYLQTKGEERKAEEIPPFELNQHLASFFIQIRQKNGQEYQPGSLRALLASFSRYLRSVDYEEAISTSKVFHEARLALKSKQKELRSQGLGNKPNASRGLSQDEIETMFAVGVFGITDPTSLVTTVWWNNIVHFGVRTGKDNRDIKWGDITLNTHPDTNKKYLKFHRKHKAYSHKDSSTWDSNASMLFSTSGDPDDPKDPVSVYMKYAEKRPPSMNHPEAPFYLSPCRKAPPDSIIWFLPQAMGHNTIDKILPTAIKRANLETELTGRVTNYSARKTMATMKDDY